MSPNIRTASRMRRVPRASELAVYSGASKLTAMALGPEVINLIRLDLLNDTNQIGAVGKVSVMQH